MEEDKHDHLGNVVRPPSLRIAKSFKGNLSGRQRTPRVGHSPSPFLRSPSLKTPKRDARLYKRTAQWIRGSRLLTLICLVAIWGYIAFHFQSSWAHSRIEEEFDEFKVSEHKNSDETPELPKEHTLDHREVHHNALHSGKAISNSSLSKSENSRARSMGEVRVRRASRRSWRRSKAAIAEINADQFNEDRDAIKHNASLGKLVGPFDMTDSRFLGDHVVKKHATCDRNGHFANFVLGKSFVVVLHEVSMTGAPLAMMELATEILGCGGKVSAITLSRRGGLLQEFTERGIPVLKDKTTPSFKVASKTDLIIVGSAVGASWIEQYLSHYKRGVNQLVWWIMENRRLYFDRSKHMLQNVKAVLFLSELQSQQWRMWCAEEGIKLPPLVDIVPLSLSDELAFVAGLQTSLNSELVGENKMLQKKNILRDEVRRLMGLDPDDMLVMSLSSINPGKGQLSLLKAALMTVNEMFALDMMNFTDETIIKNDSLSTTKIDTQFQISDASRSSREILGKLYSKRWFSSNKHTSRKLASNEAAKNQTLKLLIGSVGSKSNKVCYVKSMFSLISEHPELASRILWTPSTVHVAPLYAAADVYVINAQGIGETFGRVTIEAMAFGLPVLGTDAGGTKEIVDGNVTGLLHPIGQPGIKVLSDNLRFLQDNKAARKEMGQKGKEKVTKLYLKHQMYENFARILKLATNHN